MTLEQLLNHPAIRPYIGGDGESYVDPEPYAKPPYIFLQRDEAGMLFKQTGDSFEGHLLFPPSIRGIRALDAAWSMISEVFTEHDACAIYGSISRDNRAARVFTRALGFDNIGTFFVAGRGAVCDYRMERDKWVVLSADL